MMEQKVFATIQKYDLLHEGDNVIVALSGGADSVALLHFLLRHKDALGIRLSAAHFEHGMRGEESRRDAAFAADLCREWGVPLGLEHGRMNEIERPAGLGVEAFARRLRYGFLQQLAQRENAKVATAHTLSDNAETVLFNAVRGAGPRGLAGIPPQREMFVRPFLGVTRAEVEAYCAAYGLGYMTDSTNADQGFARNRLRHAVLPELEKVHPGAAQSLGRLAQDMREVDSWLAGEAEQLLFSAGIEEEPGGENDAAVARYMPNVPIGLDAEEAGACFRQKRYRSGVFLAAPGPVRLYALSILAGRNADRTTLSHMEQVLEGRLGAVQLPGQDIGRLDGGMLVFERKYEGNEAAERYEIPLREGEIHLPGGYRLRVEYVPVAGGGEVYENSRQKGLTFAADCDKILECSVLRPRRTGDRFKEAGRGVTKTLKKWMNEKGVPPKVRDTLPLLAAGERVLWVWGTGFCEGLQPDKDTRRLVVIRTHCEEAANNA